MGFEYTIFYFFRNSGKKSSDIKIGFESGDHGDDNRFDGPGNVLAHAVPPTDGRLHCDSEELWSIGAIPNYVDLETVALHEIGHLLGLDHSEVQDAIMFPTIPLGAVKDLHADGVQGIKTLYNI
ncbi:metalloendoproteinase 3-MMP-like [Apium graveolens]|uniref:metalloendoproteinase 3-MMP-like n=1 Tax=Apium graveolens TaxID=4045 RepID=UPI003D79D991